MIGEHDPPGYCKFNGALSSVGSERLPYKQEVAGSNPAAPIELTGFWECDVRHLCPLNGFANPGSGGPPALS